ncbi:MAG: alpha-ketoglutarate-dependent dioxygenase AlkB [Kistimonas sp.]|nr:alpha-ketoglutarate-dependent dioxygenase AlkB [Kistimonas sp.]
MTAEYEAEAEPVSQTAEVLELDTGTFVYHWPQWLPPRRADRLFRSLYEHTPWRQETLFLFGRQHAVPRLQAWFGDPDASYSYSGISLTPLPWPADLQAIRDRLCRLIQVPFNGVLVNLYRDGRDSMGWHSDNEPELGSRPVIASLSLGERRRFRLRQIRNKKRIHTLGLDHGSLLVMAAGVQEAWQHQVPRTAAACQPRINMTFRCLLSSA